MSDQIRALTPAGPYDVPAELLAAVAEQAAYAEAEHAYDQALAGAGAARHAQQNLPHPFSSPAAPEAAKEPALTRTEEIVPDIWVTPDSGAISIEAGADPVQIWPSLPDGADFTVVNTGANPVKVAEAVDKLRRGGGVTVAGTDGYLTISIRDVAGYAYSELGSTLEVSWTARKRDDA